MKTFMEVVKTLELATTFTWVTETDTMSYHVVFITQLNNGPFLPGESVISVSSDLNERRLHRNCTGHARFPYNWEWCT